ncbi:excinuclease ABC subunit UvrA [Corynebacterium glaucum]|uniref:excinuclease ABC subunit UvrA n=1 Tax=Corynebacterium glaucum TaxID=187491 RepID=UPI0025B3F204|nr:excinuclease ABC subunit UvrA [Corynebacterium glaucum]WJZ07882.1 UvrABC system protein A [Corynebacterium glaucum]
MTTSPAIAADAHDFIVVTGANENNLKDVSVRVPKRRLTVFAGLSGSGKSSLVFDTIAAESQRLINESYSTFVQGFMPTMARPDVVGLEGITAAIVVDQSPMGANPRSTVGTATDVTALLRVLYSRIAEPKAGGPGAYSFNVPSVSGGGVLKDTTGKKKVLKNYTRTGGMCPTCAGTGRVSEFDEAEVVDDALSLEDGALLAPGYKAGSWQWRQYAESGKYPNDMPVGEFTKEQRHELLYAEAEQVKFAGINTTYQGLIVKLKASLLSKEKEGLQKHVREFVDRAVTAVTCSDCGGTRLAPHALESTINGKNIAELCAMEVADLADWFEQVEEVSVAPLVASIREALANFVDIGLGYLTLNRPSSTLSGGEAQRVKMIRHLGSALSDVTYVFDEPTAGLHAADIDRLNTLLLALRDKGNTVLVVEHRPQTIEIADHVVELGPGAGIDGGEVVFQGTVGQLREAGTRTGESLKRAVVIKEEPREPTGWIRVEGATENNLNGIDVDVPTGVLAAITGVAGSGKSSLLRELQYADELADAVWVDQAAIAGSRRSNPATYTGALDSIRKAFAKASGEPASLFSPNSEGACPHCKGAGVVYVDLGVVQGVDVPCEVCEGRRFDDAVLVHTLGGKNISEVLTMPASEAQQYLKDNKVTAASKICGHLVDVGLGYVTLGQSLTTLSGGERQRLKLAANLKKLASAYVLDEPTTGLHLADTARLVTLFEQLVAKGSSVIVVEHNLAVVGQADYVIDVGPGAGSAGGRIVAHGTPADLIRTHDATGSVTGRHLAAAAAQEM